MPLAPGTLLGTYQILRKIGAGGMGEVYKAEDKKLGRWVAIKVLPAAFAADPERLRRFEQEARTVSALNHPNILTVHDLGSHEGSPFLVMELLEGETLREKLGPGGLPSKKVLEIGLQLAKGLAAAHEKGIVHRDLKPENVFLTRDERVKILDFGLAKLKSLLAAAPLLGEEPTMAVKADTTHTEAGMVMGTVAYMSPEQAQGMPLDGRSDLFSMGVILWEMVTGTRPFQRDSTLQTLQAIIREEPPDLDSGLRVQPLLERVLRSCLSKNPEGRFHSAHDLAFALHSALEAGTPSAGAEAQVHANRPATMRRRWPWAAAGLMAVGVAAILFWAPWRREATHTPSVLALPARVLGSQESAFLSDAIPSNLTSRLVGVEGLDIKLPPSSLQMEKLKGDVGKVAEAYGVEQLVVTTVTAQGQSLILNVQLVLAATQKVRWAGQYEGTLGTYNQLVGQAAEALVRALKPGLADPPIIAEPTAGSEIELALQEGRHYMGRFDTHSQPGDYERAKDALERALKKDPACAPALGNLAFLQIQKSWADGPDKEDDLKGEAERLARRALALDPRTSMAWAALAQSGSKQRPLTLEKILGYGLKAANPKFHQPDSGVNLAGVSGGPIFMAAAGRRAFEKNPLAVTDGSMAAVGLTWMGKPQEALVLLDKALSIEPGFRFGVVAKSEALVALGRFEEARRLLDRCEPAEKDLSWVAELWRQVRFELAIAQGDRATAGTLADRGSRLWLAPGSRSLDGNACVTMPPGLMRLGRREETLRLLEKNSELFPGAEGQLRLLNHPDLRPLRGDPRYDKLVEQGRQNVALAVRMLQDAKARGELPAHLDRALAELRELLRATPGSP
jgi:tetratricopeptide (TPR) repeat protein